MQEVELTLPYPPSVNHYKTIGRMVKTKSGKTLQMRVNSRKTTQYFTDVWAAIHCQCVQSFHDATISMEVDVYPPDKRKRDLDGCLKVLLDAMQHGGLYDDDHQIARLLVTRMAVFLQGKIVVRIKTYAHP